MKDSDQILNDILSQNAFMVTEIKGYAVTMRALDSILAEGKDGPALIIEDLLARNLIGDDGKVVDFSIGALVSLKKEGNQKLRLANLGADNLPALTKVAQAKMILGL